MRLAGQQKAGFFPIPPDVVDFMVKFLDIKPGTGTHTILDPCCGRGAAVDQFAGLLGIKQENVFAIELDINCGEEARKLMSSAKILTPADFMGSKMTFGCISLAWVNPPYDDEIGGGKREEARFLAKVTDAIVRKGVLMLALPQPVLERNYDIQRMLMTQFEDLLIVNYPEEHRHYRECVVFGKRRKEWVSAEAMNWRSATKQYYGEPDDKSPKFSVPTVAEPPRTFQRSQYLDHELFAAMQAGRLKKVFYPPNPKPVPRPGLQLSSGQRALVLAGGFLNRVLEVNDGPILIKSSPYKESYVKDCTEEEIYNERTGQSEMKTTTIVSERICLKVRVLDQEGVIHDVR